MKNYVRLVFLVLLLGVGPAEAAVDWEVLSSDETSLHLRVTISEATLAPREGGLSTLRLPGAHLDGEPGMPALPVDARWIALPPTGAAVLSVVSSRIEDFGSARLAPVPVPHLLPEDFEGPRLVEQLEFADDYESFSLGEAGAAVLSQPVYQRRHRMASVGIRPVLYDASSGRIRIVRELELIIRWPAVRPGTQQLVRNDPTIIRSVLNPDQAREWATWSPRHERLREIQQNAPLTPRSAPRQLPTGFA